MSKTILSALAALAILSGISSAAIAAPDTKSDGYASEQASDPFDFWDKLAL